MSRLEDFEQTIVQRGEKTKDTPFVKGFATEAQNALETVASWFGLQSLAKKIAGDNFSVSDFSQFLNELNTRTRTLANNKLNLLASTIEKMELVQNSPTVRTMVEDTISKLKKKKRELETKINLAISKESLAESKAAELAAMQSGDRSYGDKGREALSSAKNEAEQANEIYKDVESTVI